MNAAPHTRVSRGEGVALGIIATGAISVAIAALVAIIQRAFELFGSDVTVRMPVTGGDVTELAGVSAVTAAEYASAEITFTTLPVSVSWLLFLEGALPALATIGVCVVAWWLGVSLMRSRPFRPAMSTAIGITACLVIVGAVFGQLFGAIGRAVLVEDITASDPNVSDIFWPFLMEFDLAAVGWGLALALVAGAFSIGARLQRDTEGLV